MTSKNSGVGASTTMSSLGKACLELSKSIKGFRFSRQSGPPHDSKDSVSGCGQSQQLAGAAALAPTTVTATARPPTTEDGSACDDVTFGVSDVATGAGGGGGVAGTISRVIRSATNRVRAFPASPALSPYHQHHHQPQQQQLQACNAVNGHSPPTQPPTLRTPPPLPTPSRTTRARCIQPPVNADIWHDEQFLLRFFRYFSAVELCVLAQVVNHCFSCARCSPSIPSARNMTFKISLISSTFPFKTNMPVLVILGRKCTLATSPALPW